MFNSKVVNFNPNHDEEGKFCESDNVGIKYEQYNDLENDYREFIENEPEDYKFNNKEEIFKDLGIDENNPLLIETPIEDIKVTTKSIDHIAGGGGDGHPPDKTRYKSINKMLETLKKPMFVNEIDGKKVYFKIFKNNTDSKKDMVIIKQDNEVYTNFPVDRSSWFLKNLKQGKTIYDIKNKRRKSDISTAHVNNIIPHFKESLKSNMNNCEVENWNEQDHPRDEQGKFTSGNNGTSEYKSRFSDLQNLIGTLKKDDKFFDSKYRTAEKRLQEKLDFAKKELAERDFSKMPSVKKTKEQIVKVIEEEIEKLKELKQPKAQNSLTDTILNAIAELIIGE